MTPLLTMGETLAVNASLYPDKIGARDLTRSMTFRIWNERACRLANALRGLGLAKADRVAVLAYNCVEWMEIYAAAAKAGVIAVPIMAAMMIVVSRRQEMGDFIATRSQRIFGWAATLVMAVAAVAMIALW